MNFFRFFSLHNSKLGTHGSPRRRSAGHDPPVKHLGLGEVKRFTGGMHNTENLSGMFIEKNKKWTKSVQQIMIEKK